MINLQPNLFNQFVSANPLLENDFEVLYDAASDPLIWEQHPNPDRYKKEVFINFFKHALESKGALLVKDQINGQVIGSSRYYDNHSENNSVYIGYTFFRKEYWGGKYNYSLKLLMLQHAFQYVDKVLFHIGKNNVRSQKSIEKLGALKVREINVAYAGELHKPNYEYLISKECWPEIKMKLEAFLY